MIILQLIIISSSIICSFAGIGFLIGKNTIDIVFITFAISITSLIILIFK